MPTVNHHVITGFPPWITFPIGSFKLAYTRHALERALERNIDIENELPSIVSTNNLTPIEIEVDEDGHKILKILYRMSLDNRDDLVIIVVPGRSSMRVLTVWTNNKNDHHSNLDLTKYKEWK